MTDIDAGRPLPGIPARIRGRGVARSGIPAWIRRLDRFHPAGWVLLAALVAWGVVVMMHVQPAPTPAAHSHAGHGGSSGIASMGYGGLWLMTVAMMLPLTLGWVRDIARSSSSRHRATAAFLAGYLGVWMMAIVVIALAWRIVASHADRMSAMVGVVIAAALWEIAAAVYPPIRACTQSMPSVARGWRADLASAGSGAASGIRCVLSCWALMAACVAFAHDLRVMAILFAVQLIGRYRPLRIHFRSRRAHHPHPADPAAAPVR
jgi:predicted metal-binding membrane protein